MTPKQVLQFMKEKGAVMVDVKFIDLLGTWQHFTAPVSAVMDPFTKDPTLSLIANISDPLTRADYSRDPRNISRKAEAYLKSTGLGDAAFFGPEPEFFIFDGMRYDVTQNSSYYYIESNEGNWNSGREGAIKSGANLGYKVKNKE